MQIVCAQQTGSWSDQGDGTYKNPILETNYPDNNIIRQGDTYYMMSSTCHFTLGMVILKSIGLDKNTIVIYTSDQGMYLGDHGWFDKRFVYEESMRTPLLMRYPHEMKSVYNDPTYTNVQASLHKQLDELREKYTDTPGLLETFPDFK